MGTLKNKVGLLAGLLAILDDGKLNGNIYRPSAPVVFKKKSTLVKDEKKIHKAKRRKTNASRRINQKLVRKNGRIIK